MFRAFLLPLSQAPRLPIRLILILALPTLSEDVRIMEGIMKHWTFARGGAWRNPKPTGGPYVCEQCRLDACGGNDATLTLQAVTTMELAPADVCADCGARLLEERELKD